MRSIIKFLFFILFLFCIEFNSKSEIIYAVMITGKDKFHENLARKSVKSFLNQTYPNKHLIIINDGEYDLKINNKLITEIRLNKRYSLGNLRNIGLEHVPEDALWIQWDDDDWRHPKLIEDQYRHLLASKVDLVALKNQIQYSFKRNATRLLRRHNGIVGTILCRKKKDIVYSDKVKGEDAIFYSNYKKKYKTSAFNNPEFYYIRFIHGHNTWDDKHFGLNKWTVNKWGISVKAKNYLRKVLSQEYKG